MRFRGILVSASGVVLAALVAAIALAFSLRSSEAQHKPFSTIDLVPKDIVAYVALNIDRSSPEWQDLGKLLQSVKLQDKALKAWNEAMSEESSVSWEKDILPVLGGEACLAVTDVDAISEGRGGLILVVEVQDVGKARSLVQRLDAETGETVEQQSYQGVTIYTYEDESEGAYAFVDNSLVFGISIEDVKQVIDVSAGREPSAIENERFEGLRSAAGKSFLVWGYADTAYVIDAIARLSGAFSPPLLSSAYAPNPCQPMDRVTVTLSANSQGLVLDATAYNAPDAEGCATSSPYEARFAENVPEDVQLFMGGYDLYNTIWQPLRQSFAAMSAVADQKGFDSASAGDLPFNPRDVFETGVQQLNALLGFDIDKDFLAYFTGEFGAAARFGSLVGPMPVFDLAVLLDTSNPAATQSAMTAIQRLVETQMSLGSGSASGTVHTIPLGARPSDALAWTVSDGALIVSYPDRITRAFVEGADFAPLSENPDWKSMIGLMPEQLDGIVYVSISGIIEEIAKIPGTAAEFHDATNGELTLSDLKALRALAVGGGHVENGYTFRVALLVKR